MCSISFYCVIEPKVIHHVYFKHHNCPYPGINMYMHILTQAPGASIYSESGAGDFMKQSAASLRYFVIFKFCAITSC